MGMAAIYDPSGSLDTKKLAEGLKKSLPTYARPLFIRLLAELPMTGNALDFISRYKRMNVSRNNRDYIQLFVLGTFKLKKKDLQQEAFDIKKVSFVLMFCS